MVDNRQGRGKGGGPWRGKDTIIKYYRVEALRWFLPEQLLEAIGRIMKGTGATGSI